MATTPEHADDNVNRKEGEGRKNLSSSATDEEETIEEIDDLNYVRKASTISTTRSTNDDKKSDQTFPTSDINTGKMNEEKKVETTITTEESVSTLHSSNWNNDEESRKNQSGTSSTPTEEKQKTEKLTSQLAASNVKKDNAFSIEKGDEQHLTDFQRQKAKYFFNVNLDIENKEYVTWEDVEFYLLFHVTAAGKEGSDGGDLEARLSRATRAFWEHVHDEIPLANGERDRLTLNQFLDTWASLVDYVVRTNQLPPIVQDLVKLSFELYSTDNGDGKVTRIEPQAFDQLFQKMNLSRPYAIMAYKYLTDNGTKLLDADKVDSIVKAVITSSDDEHESHFLIPGFFKTIADNKTNEKEKKSPSSVQEKAKTEANGKSTPPSQPSNTFSTHSPPRTQQKPNEQPSSQQQTSSPPSTPAQEKKPERSSSTQKQPTTPYQNGFSRPSTAAPSVYEEQNLPPKLYHEVIEQEDEGIRRLLHYYHIDDGDIVEVAGGSLRRLVRVHPERPLPSYIQQDKQLLHELQSDSKYVPSVQQNGSTHDQKSASEAKPKVTLEERRSRGETQKGPTVPSRQEPKWENSSSTGVRQVYPQLSTAQQEEQRQQANLQVKPEKQTTEGQSTAPDVTSAKQDGTKQSKDISRDDEEKIIATILKQLAPIVEKRVLAELRRLHSDETDQDEDEDVMPFPFMLGGGFPFFAAAAPPPPRTREQQSGTSQDQQQGNIPRGVDFGGLPPGVGMLPPQLLMAMMNDLAQGGMGGDGPGYPPNMSPPPRGPAGAEGFMMFVDGDQAPGGPARF